VQPKTGGLLPGRSLPEGRQTDHAQTGRYSLADDGAAGGLGGQKNGSFAPRAERAAEADMSNIGRRPFMAFGSLDGDLPSIGGPERGLDKGPGPGFVVIDMSNDRAVIYTGADRQDAMTGAGITT
jgi:hypothetical protein